MKSFKTLNHVGLTSILVACALGLAACAGSPSVSCTVTYNPNASAGNAKTKAMNLATQDVATIDTSGMYATISSTGALVSDPGVFTVTLLSGGSVVASTQAPYTRTGSTFTPSNPSALNAWIQSYAGSIDEADISIDNFTVAQVQGTNQVGVSSNYGGGAYASATTSWIHNNY